VTEEEWLTDCHPQGLLKFIGPRASDRKLRLIGCACVRRVWHVLNDRHALGALHLLEAYADGERTDLSVRQALNKSGRSWQATPDQSVRVRLVAFAVADVVNLSARGEWLADLLQHALSNARCVAADDDEPAIQADLVRDVIGNPFRPATLDPSALTPLTRSLAEAAYAGRSSSPTAELADDRLAVLGDALEDAGCDDDALLSHLRSRGPHVRGCWALDVVLGKR
jgi:hypothetical protein